MTPILLLGLDAGQLAALFAAAGAAVVALYILKQQRRRIEVPFVQLWQRVLKQSEATSLWRKLVRLLSLLLQLLLLGLLVLSLGDPRLGRSERGRSLVLLLDASASMQAVAPGGAGTDERGPTRLALAKQQAKELVRSLSGDDLAVVVALDGQPAPLGGLSDDQAELTGQIDAVVARDTPADLPAALELARALLAGRPRPTVILFSDGGFDEVTLAQTRPALDVRYVPLPRLVDPAAFEGAGNAAITAFSVRRYRRNRLSYEVLISLAWYPGVRSQPVPGTTPPRQKVILELLQEGEVVDVQHLELLPGEQSQRLYPNLSGAGQHLTARLRLEDGAQDVLPVDDRAFAVLPERRRLKVLVVTRGNLFLEGALLAAGAGEENHLQIDKLAPGAYKPEVAARYDAVIFDGFTPPQPPDSHALYFDPQGPASPFPSVSVLKAPLFSDLETSHPVLRWVSLGDVNMSRSQVFKLQPGDVALASMVKQPLIVAREDTTSTGARRRQVAVGFDLRQSDLPLRVAFPVFLMNAVDWFAGDVDEDLGSFRTGHTWRVPVSAGGAATAAGTSATGAGGGKRRGRPDEEALRISQTDLVLPEGGVVTVPVYEGHALYYGQRIGFYALRAAALGTTVQWAANLSDQTESQALLRRELRLGGSPVLAPEAGQRSLRRELWPYLLLLSLGLLLIEWWTYHRRWTV
ncbi:MAG: VWA domain-containing protein [Polyangia bacterium]